MAPSAVDGICCAHFHVWHEWHGQLIKASMHCRITIHFEAVNNAFYAWLNGQLLGYSQDSCLPAEFDVTDIVSTDQNILTVQVWAPPPIMLAHPLLRVWEGPV